MKTIKLAHAQGQIYDEETGKTLALLSHFDKDNKEHEELGNLMAAAPEMLKVLKKIEDKMLGEYRGGKLSKEGRELHREAMQAISIATE